MKLLGYANIRCPNCGRLRVEVWDAGYKNYNICEKCSWCIELKEYLDVDKMLNDMRGKPQLDLVEKSVRGTEE